MDLSLTNFSSEEIEESQIYTQKNLKFLSREMRVVGIGSDNYGVTHITDNPSKGDI
jgi:hypothetical protein